MNTKSFEKIINEAWESRNQVNNKSKVLTIALSIFLLDLELILFLLFQASFIIFSKEIVFIMLLSAN